MLLVVVHPPKEELLGLKVGLETDYLDRDFLLSFPQPIRANIE